MTNSEVLEFLQKEFPSHKIVLKDSALYVDDLRVGQRWVRGDDAQVQERLLKLATENAEEVLLSFLKQDVQDFIGRSGL